MCLEDFMSTIINYYPKQWGEVVEGTVDSPNKEHP